jgi:hypothetical protein
MSIQRGLILGWMVAGLQVLAVGQNTPVQNQPVQSSDNGVRTAPAAPLSVLAGMQSEASADDLNSSLPRIPGLLGGAGISSAFLSELRRSNYLRGGINVSAAYDDNPFLVSSGATSNTSVSIFPNLSIEESSSTIRWRLGYSGGLTIDENLASQNQDSQNLNFDSQYRLSPHVNLRVAENFSLTTGFFDAGNGSGSVIGSGGPNTSLITPLATQRSSVSTVETNYHFALNDLVGASGSFYDSHFSNLNAGEELTNTQTATGSAFWLHRLVRADWAGASYRFDRITFNGGESRVHSFYAVNTLNLSNRFTLTGFVGPQYSDNQGLAPGGLQASNSWSVAGGVEGGWQEQRTSASAGYSRIISDGGGLLDVVRLQNVHATFRRELVSRWAVAVSASRGANQSLIVPTATSASSINLTSAGIALDRNVGRSFGLRMGYSHDFQAQMGLPAPDTTLNASRNRFFVTVSYQWAKPLGM